MENSYLHKSQKKKLKIYSDLDLHLSSEFEIATQKSSADLELRQVREQDKIELVLPNKTSLIAHKNNLEYVLKTIAKMNYSKPSPTSFFKGIINKKQLGEEVSLLKNLIDIEHSADFFQSLLNLKQYSHFHTFHLFSHSKGTAYAEKFIIDKKNIRESKVKIENFNHIFHSIKKSKQVSFAESTFKSSGLDIAGTCLAKAFNSRSNNIIIIATRNEFIPYSSTERDEFNEFCLRFETIVGKILEKFQLESLHKLLANVNQKILELPLTHLAPDNNYHQKRVLLLGELLNTLRHELSNPLFGIQLLSNILEQESEDQDELELLRQIDLAIKKSLAIINNFLGMYSENTTPKKLNLKNLLDEIFTLTKSETKSIRREIICNDEITIVSNPTYLTQILLNLILNSSQALKKAQISKPLISIAINPGPDNISIEFKDNGPGIPSEREEKIFDPFFTTKSNGTGLGLAICRSMATKLGGSIQCRKSDKGACFSLLLPYEYTAHRR